MASPSHKICQAKLMLYFLVYVLWYRLLLNIQFSDVRILPVKTHVSHRSVWCVRTVVRLNEPCDSLWLLFLLWLVYLPLVACGSICCCSVAFSERSSRWAQTFCLDAESMQRNQEGIIGQPRRADASPRFLHPTRPLLN